MVFSIPSASVLGGVIIKEKSTITNLDSELGDNSRYTIYFSTGSAPSNLPSEISTASRFFLEIINNGSDIIQRVTVRGTNVAYQRVRNSNTWSSWSRMDAFGCSTAADLASLLGGIRKVEGYPANIDNINFNSTYHTYPADSQGTFPSGYSATTSMDITTVVYGSNARTQYITCGGTSETHVRHYDGATWAPWVRMDNFGCNTAADLASLLGALGRGLGYEFSSNITSFDDIPHGIFLLTKDSSSFSNCPRSGDLRGFVLCFRILSSNIYSSQIYVDGQYQEIYFRCRGTSSGWSSWKKLAFVS